jgi:hypothetical protein
MLLEQLLNGFEKGRGGGFGSHDDHRDVLIQIV